MLIWLIFKFEKSTSNPSLKEFVISILSIIPEALIKFNVSSQLEFSAKNLIFLTFTSTKDKHPVSPFLSIGKFGMFSLKFIIFFPLKMIFISFKFPPRMKALAPIFVCVNIRDLFSMSLFNSIPFWKKIFELLKSKILYSSSVKFLKSNSFPIYW